MCGIAGGAWSTRGESITLSQVQQMTNAIAHRGPDDSGFYHSELEQHEWDGHSQVELRRDGAGATLAFRRLSIIDLSTGHQPLSNEDGTIWISFNGEIYNYRELQAELLSRGHRFRTQGDTETIVHLYEEMGPRCVEKLRGMFAIALWDSREKRLFLARDRLGKKPLVYHYDGERIVYASELKALLTIPGLKREIEPTALLDYLTWQYVPHPKCMLKGFKKLPPAHFALFHEGNLTIERYWRPGFEADWGSSAELLTSTASSMAEASAAVTFGAPPSEVLAGARAQLRATLTDAVRLRMRSDVPLGAFLSGGIDSTIIAGLMQSESSQPIKTFTIGFPQKSFDEREPARRTAQFLGTDHHELLIEPQALEILPKLIWHYDEPFADSSAIPTMYLSEMTRQHVTVALSGDGGDELFAGYDRYHAVAVGERFDRLPAFVRSILTGRFWQRLPASTRQKSRRRRFKRLLSALGYPRERRYLKWISIIDDERLPGLLSDDLRSTLAQHDPAMFLLSAYQECPRRDFVTRTTAADVLTYLPCDILNKVDIASMAYSLEVRAPFLDQEVVELAARMPIEWKRHSGKGKQIVRETFADLIPPEIQNLPKMGFGVPLDSWFRNELRPLLEGTLLTQKSLERGWFDRQSVKQLVEDHFADRWDHSYRLWALLVFELWQQRFIDRTATPLA